MMVTEVRIRAVTDSADGRMKGVASITIDGEFVIHDIRIIKNEDRLFVAMPSKRMPDGTFRDTAHPISQRMRNHIQEAVLFAYHEALNEKTLAAGA